MWDWILKAYLGNGGIPEVIEKNIVLPQQSHPFGIVN